MADDSSPESTDTPSEDERERLGRLLERLERASGPVDPELLAEARKAFDGPDVSPVPLDGEEPECTCSDPETGRGFEDCPVHDPDVEVAPEGRELEDLLARADAEIDVNSTFHAKDRVIRDLASALRRQRDETTTWQRTADAILRDRDRLERELAEARDALGDALRKAQRPGSVLAEQHGRPGVWYWLWQGDRGYIGHEEASLAELVVLRATAEGDSNDG